MMAKAYAGFTLAQMKSVADGLSNQLVAANARIAELEANLQYAEFVRKEFESALMNNENAVEAYKYWRQRAEQAEEKVKRLIKKITFNTPRLDNFGDNEYLLSIDENDLIPAEPCVCDKMEQAEAQAAAMREAIHCDIENCDHLKEAGSSQNCPYDESQCNNYHSCREIHANNAGSALLSWMERMREALKTIRRCVSTCNTPIETVNAMDRIAAEALEGRDGKPEGKKRR